MSAKARRKITVTYSNDVEGEQEINAAENAASPASVQLVVLPAYDVELSEATAFEVDIPPGATAVTIMKPTDNTYAIIYSGDPADAGVKLHPTDPDSISLDSTVTFFYLSSLNIVDITCRLFWS